AVLMADRVNCANRPLQPALGVVVLGGTGHEPEVLLFDLVGVEEPAAALLTNGEDAFGRHDGGVELPDPSQLVRSQDPAHLADRPYDRLPKAELEPSVSVPTEDRTPPHRAILAPEMASSENFRYQLAISGPFCCPARGSN